jgi:large subunit ribosomal protein L4e
MKAHLYTASGEKHSTIDLPALFSTKVRLDLIKKYLEAEKANTKHPYSHYKEAGKRHSASGTISHLRHDWKGHYGKGIARIPRKTMYRRGTQFFWIGAEVASARGGRSVHGPKLERAFKKINSKEMKFAFNSALAATTDADLINKRYSTINKISEAPFVITELPTKAKAISAVLEKIFSENTSIVFKEKSVRTGKGKKRGRMYKSNAGLLIVKSKSELVKFPSVDIKSVGEVSIKDLYPLGRLTLYTKKALEELSNRGENKK